MFWAGSIMRVILGGRRSIWWRWKVSAVAPSIVNDVSYVSGINHESHFAWEAQHLARLVGESGCSEHSKWRFICGGDHACHFTWEARHLARLEGESGCSPHCKWRFICDGQAGESCWSAYCKWHFMCDTDQWWESFCVADTTFGDVGWIISVTL